MTVTINTDFNSEIYSSIVSRFFAIEDVTIGSAQQGYVMRYHGKLRDGDSSSHYDQLAGLLQPYGLTPLFRMDKDRQAVILVNGLARTRPSNPWVNVILGVLTLISVLIAGGFYSTDTNIFANGITLNSLITFLSSGLPYGISLLAILGAHEFGHYLVGRFHKTPVTLPYFIPMPFPGSFGTLGAFINMKAPPKNRRILLDIGIAGPLAGLIVAIPILLIGLNMSAVSRLPLITDRGAGLSMEGNSLLYLASKFFVFHQLLPAPASYGTVSPVIYWLRYIFTAHPLPYGALDVNLSPVAWAGWVGILVTSLNLIPAGQLDGGHMLYVLLGTRQSQRILPIILVILVLLGFVWQGWWLWAALIFFFGRVYAEPLDQITPLDTTRKLLAVLALIIFVLVFTPVPLTLIFNG